MKRIITIAGALAVLLLSASCTKTLMKVEEAKDTNATLQSISVNATLPSAGSELKSSFDPKDFLRIRFAKADGSMTGRTQVLNINPANANGASGTFSADNIAVPNDAATAYVYVDNHETCKVNYGSLPTHDNISSMAGNFGEFSKYQVIMGTLGVNSLNGASVNLEYKTAVVEINVIYPDNIAAAIGLPVTLSSEGQFNDVYFDTTTPTIDSELGDITSKISSIGSAGSKVKGTTYVTVWPMDGGLKNADITSKIGAVTYGKDVDLSNVKPGSYTSVTVELETRIFNYYISDAEKKYSNVKGNITSGPDWIVKSGNDVIVKENTSGAARTGTAKFDNGTEITVTQIGPNDFKGSYTFTAKAFSNNTSIVKAGNNTKVGVTFTEPLNAGELTDCNGVSYTSNLGIVGLYDTAVMDASVVIDYEARSAKFAILLDARTAQAVTKSNISGYNYVCFLPELGTGSGTNWGSPYVFVPADLDTEKDYVWLEFTASEDMKSFTWNSFTQEQYLKGNLAPAANRIIGITCAVCKDKVASKDNVYGTYNVIYQGNTNSDKIVPVSFVKN